MMKRTALRPLVLFALLLSLTAVAPSSEAQKESSEQPNVLLITVDTLRPDALGWVSGAEGTPNADRLAKEGCAFPAAVTTAPLTAPAHASILTALVPRRHGVRDNGQVLGVGMRTLAETLGRAGYATGAFTSGYPLSPEFGLDRGFDQYDGVLALDGEELERPAAETTAAAAKWLQQQKGKWFLWVHYYDPHAPYEPPADLLQDGPRGAYQGEVAAVDRALGDLLKAAQATSSQPPLTIFTADHGESLGEHGEETHGFFVYDSTVLVPLIFHWPGEVLAGKCRADVHPRLVDIAPTLFELLGMAPWNGVDGISVMTALAGFRQTIPGAYIESLRPYYSYGWAPLKALRNLGWKLIVAPKMEIYDLSIDPGETENRILSPQHPARRLAAGIRAAEAQPPMGSGGAADPETVARLRALGYTGGGPSHREPPEGLPDPKDRLETWNLLGEAEDLLQRDQPADALQRFDQALEQDPGNSFALARSGFALLQLERPEDAVKRLQEAAEKAPDQPEIRLTLAHALGKAGRHEDAASQWQELLALQPERVTAWSRLGTALGLAGRSEDAVSAFQRAAELAPESSSVALRLAFAQFAAGQKDEAVKTFLAVAQLTGADEFPHPSALGLLLVDRQRESEALAWLRRGRSDEGDYARGQLTLARLELGQEETEAARQALRRALDAQPKLRDEITAGSPLESLLPPQ